MSRRRILIIFLAFLAILMIGGYVVLHQTGAARALVRKIIGNTIHEDLFRLEDAEIDLTAGTVTVTKFEIQNPEVGTGGAPLLSVDKIEVEVETNPLGEVGAVRHVSLDGLVLNLSLAEGELPELSQILKVAGVDSSEGTLSLPSITVTNSILHLRFARERPTVTFSKLRMSVRAVASDPNELTLEGTMVSPLGHIITIRGGGNARTKTFRTLLTMRDIPIRPEQAAAFQSEAAAFLDTAKVTGIVKEATLWMDFREGVVAGTQELQSVLRAGLNAEFENLSAAPELFPYQIHGATGRIHASLTNNGAIKFRLENKAVDGDVTVTGKLTECLTDAPIVDLQVDIENLLVGPRLIHAFSNSPIDVVKKFERAFAPSAGRVSAKLRIGNADRAAGLGITGDITLDGLAATFHGFRGETGQHIGFPHPLHDVSGTVSLRPGRITFDGISAKDIDGAVITMDGNIELVDLGIRANLDIRGTGIRFSPSIRRCVGMLLTDGTSIYDTYAPEGKASFEVRLRDFGRGLRYTVDITPLAASAAYLDFPYRVRQIGGLIKISNNGIWIDIRGRNGPTPISVNGRFVSQPGSTSNGVRSELWVKATELPLDAALKKAAGVFSKEIQGLWDRVRPTGTIGCEFTMWKEAKDEDFSYDVHLHVVEGDARVRDLPLVVHSLSGDVFIHGTGSRFRCDISPMRGEVSNGPDQPSAKILAQGTIHQGPDGLATDITTIVRQLRLSDQLGRAVSHAGITTQDQWDALKIDGFVDIIARYRKLRDRPGAEQSIVLRLRDVSSRASAIPGKAHDLHGEITVEGTEARFDLIEGYINDTKVKLSRGTLDLSGAAPVLKLTIDSESIPIIDHELGALMSGPVRAAFLGTKMSGRVGLKQFSLTMRFGADPQLRLDGKITAHDLFMDVGLPGGHSVRHLTGAVRVNATIDNAGGKLTGQLENVSFVLSNQRFSATTTHFDLNAERLTLHGLRFNVAEGLVEGNGPQDLALRYEFAGLGKLSAFLRYRQVSLNALLKGRGVAHSKVRGLLAGTLTIEELTGNNLLDMRAKGEVVVSNGRLGRVPLFSALYSHIAEDKRPQFTQGRAKFVFENQRIHLSEIRARSKEIRLEGEGTIAMDGYMDVRLRLPRVFGRAADIFILPPLIDWTVSKVVRFQLYGYIREPKLSWTFNKIAGRTALSPIGPVPIEPSYPRHAPAK